MSHSKIEEGGGGLGGTTPAGGGAGGEDGELLTTRVRSLPLQPLFYRLFAQKPLWSFTETTPSEVNFSSLRIFLF